MAHDFTNVDVCTEHDDCAVLYQGYRVCPICEMQSRVRELEEEVSALEETIDTMEDRYGDEEV